MMDGRKLLQPLPETDGDWICTSHLVVCLADFLPRLPRSLLRMASRRVWTCLDSDDCNGYDMGITSLLEGGGGFANQISN